MGFADVFFNHRLLAATDFTKVNFISKRCDVSELVFVKVLLQLSIRTCMRGLPLAVRFWLLFANATSILKTDITVAFIMPVLLCTLL